jgi:hypothetical protein
MTTPRAPLLIAFLIVAVPTVAILFVVAIQSGPVVLVLLVVCVGVLSWIALRFARALFGLIQSYATAKYEHAEAMANKGVLVVGRGFPEYRTRQAQITSPQIPQHKQIEWKPELEKWRWTAVDYVALTIDTLGRDSKKLISANEAQKLDDWKSAGRVQNAFDFLSGNLLAYVKMTGGKQEGTYIQDEMNAGELMAILSPARLRGAK